MINKTVVYNEERNQFALEESGGVAPIPSGTDRQVMGYINGTPTSVTLGWKQYSDLPTAPSFANGVLAGTAFQADGSAIFAFVELNALPNAEAKATTIPMYGTGGVLKVANGIANTDAVNKSQLDAVKNSVPTSTVRGGVLKQTNIPDMDDSRPVDVTDINAILAVLRGAGLM